MFSTIPRRYDLLNRVLTWGFDERWREKAARECLRHASGRVLDLCCGTGDLALHVAGMSAGELEVLGLDFSRPMLEEARRKAATRGLLGLASFIQGDAADLPFRDNHFSVVGISFAFRNVTYRNPLTSRYLSEVHRVLEPGGRFVIVETSQPKNGLFRAIVHSYHRLFVSRIGGMISGHSGAYRYLAESARRFFSAAEVCQLLLNARFREAESRPLLGGVSALHVALK
jgi:demethylmenaquinone methyltransferase/2-methoxy-6-polyprenyl-1,4-benzoquinol methylase